MTPNSSEHPLLVATGPHDPRLYDIDEDFRQVLIDLSWMVSFSANHRKRFLHPTSIGVRGLLQVVAAPEIPAHGFFRPGRTFPVIGRYSNSQGEDDLEVTVRGLSLRLLDTESGTAPGLLDLTLNTGECFFAYDADSFRRLSGEEAQRDRVLADHPRLRTTLWSSTRSATAYPAYDFHSQAPKAFIAEDGTPWLARYRVIPKYEPIQPGHHDPGDRWWLPTPPDAVPRPADDPRPATALRDQLCAQVTTTGVDSLLQIRLHPATGPADEIERALDASRPWPAHLPWLDLAHLRFDRLLPDDETAAMVFDPALAPADLGITLSRSPYSTASLSHLRALVYRMTSLARTGKPVPEPLAELLRPVRRPVGAAGAARTVCVLGAGPSGLAAAREIERNGHHAIVVEAAAEVGGKSASVELDGHAYDLGAHICTGRYRRVAALAAEVGVATEPTASERVLRVGPSGRTTTDMSFFTDGSVERYEVLRAERFPRIREPGLAHSAAELAKPLPAWLAEHGLESMYTTFGLGYTCAGYGYPDDDLPALYFVKYVEMTGLLRDTTPEAGHVEARFTIEGGFGSLWRKVAQGLRDVRCDVRVLSIERHERGVRVRTTRGQIDADELLITVPPDQVLDVLDVTEQERELAALVRYHSYRTTVASVSGLPREGIYLLGDHADASNGRGHCIGFQHRYPDSDVYTCYSYNRQETIDQTQRDIEACGGRDYREHLHRDWTLMPHFDSAGLRVGALERIEVRQGQRHTYFTGGLLGFESVECVVGHAQELARQAFPARGPVLSTVTEQAGVPAVRSAPELSQWLVDRIAEELDIAGSEVDPTGALAEYAFDSLAQAELFSDLSDYLGYRVPHTLFLQLPTIAAVASYLAENDGTAPERKRPAGVRRLSPTDQPPFFCVGGIGASGAYLRPLAAALGPGQLFYALELPGHPDGAREAMDDVEEMASTFVEQVREVTPDGPYQLGGHSFGGVVAYEMGRQLRAAGADVAPVAVLDSFVALRDQPEPAADAFAALHDLLTVRHMSCVASGVCDCAVDLTQPLAQQREEVARALGAVDPDRYDHHVIALIEHRQRAVEAYAAYQTPPSDLTVHLLKTDNGFAPMPADGFGVRLHLDSPSNGWEHVELASLKVFPISGNHFSMFMPPHLEQVAEAVRAAMPIRV